MNQYQFASPQRPRAIPLTTTDLACDRRAKDSMCHRHSSFGLATIKPFRINLA